jgi:hypothetical protein
MIEINSLHDLIGSQVAIPNLGFGTVLDVYMPEKVLDVTLEDQFGRRRLVAAEDVIPMDGDQLRLF